MVYSGKGPIGIFDSGVGGLTVVKSVRKAFRNEDILYFGDTARVPYGNKSKSTITRFSRQISDFLIAGRVKLIVVACNTASSFSGDILKRTYDVPVIEVISPGAHEAARLSIKGRIGVIGTEATIESGSYEKALKNILLSLKVFSEACPLFVPLVENKMTSGEITMKIARKYLNPFKNKNIDTLILGCTHYPMLKPVISTVLGGVKLVDSAQAVAGEIDSLFKRNIIARNSGVKKGGLKCYVSDAPDKFKQISGIFLKEKVNVKKAVLT